MATGYTSCIEEGATFKEFTLGCARAFGALYHMRDEPRDVEVTEIKGESEYNREELIKAKKGLAEAMKINLEDAEIQANENYNEIIKHNKDQIRKIEELKIKYLEMLTQVKDWEPPTSAHANLKEFMIEQIEESIKHDCTVEYWKKGPTKKTAKQWLKDHIETKQWSIDYHSKQLKEDKDRYKDTNDWIRQLKDSLE